MAEDKKDATPKLSKTQEQVMELVEKMTVLELSQLVKAMEEKFGVSASAPVAAVAAAAPQAGGEEAEEKSVFDVVLAEVGSNKIAVIKVVRELAGVGLKEAKDLVESDKPVIKKEVNKDEAEEIKKKLEEAGAKVELK